MWECPYCKKAYTKVNHKEYSKEQIKAKNAKFLKERALEKNEQKIKGKHLLCQLTAFVGMSAVLSELACSFAGVQINPITLGMGGAIVIWSAMYYFSTLSN